MRNYLKRNWPVLIYIITGILFMFFLQPAEEKHYLETDARALVKSAQKILIIVLTVIALVCIIWAFLSWKEPLKQIFGAIAFLILLGVVVYCITYPFLTTTVLFINRQYSRNQQTHHYTILRDPASGKGYGLLDVKNNTVHTWDIPQPLLQQLQENSGKEVTVMFHTGLFNARFHPHIAR